VELIKKLIVEPSYIDKKIEERRIARNQLMSVMERENQ